MLHAHEGRGVSSLAQRAHVGLGVALVTALEVLGELDVLYLAALVVCDHGLGHFVETLRAAGAAVEDSADLGVVEQPEVNGHHVVDVDEVALLTAGAISFAALEQAHAVAVLELLLHVKSHAGHAALVLLTRAVDIEVAQTDHGALEVLELEAQVLIEQEFGEGVGVERVFVAAVLLEHAAATVDRGRRGVIKRHTMLARPAQQDLGVFVVHPHHELAVPLRGGRAGALVEHGLDRPEAVASLHALQEVVLVEVVADVRVRQVQALTAVGQIVHNQDVGDATGVEPLHEVAADEAGTAGDDDHVRCSCTGAGKSCAAQSSRLAKWPSASDCAELDSGLSEATR